MKVAVVGPGYPVRGGISHYTTTMVNRLRSAHDVLFVSYRKQYPDILYPGRTQLDCSAEPILADCLPVISFLNPATWLRAAGEISRYAPDVLVLSWVSPALAVQLRTITGLVKSKSPGVEVVFICHNVKQHEARAVDAVLTRAGMKKADRFIVHGEADKADLEALFPGVHARVVPLPGFDFFPGAGMSREEARSRLGLEPDAPVALYFGFVRPYKGLVHLLRALPLARGRLPGLRLLVVGEFWESRRGYERELDRLGVRDSVTLVDRYVPNEEVRLYFSAADVVVLPYVSATGSAIVQVAYGFSRPVISTRVGGLPEAVDDGRTGFLVRPGDPGALAAAMVDFFERGLGPEFSRNIEDARSRFSWGSLIKAIEARG